MKGGESTVDLKRRMAQLGADATREGLVKKKSTEEVPRH